MSASRTDCTIRAVEIYRFDVPLREPFRIATMVASAAENVLVRVLTRDGPEGWGEASPFHAITGETQGIDLAAARDLRPLLLGRSALETAALARDLERFLPHNATIRGAFDMALHDVAARAAGLPLWAFLGGTRREIETDLTIAIGDPERAGAKAAEAAARGFRTIKTKVGVSLADDLRRLRGIREALGPDAAIRIDANQGWTRRAALEALEAFAPLDIELCEQPVRAADVEGLREVAERSPIPVMADEALFTAADALRLAAARAAPLWNIKLSKSGGIAGALRLARIAEAAGIDCMAGCMLETRLGITASAHAALASDAFVLFDLDSFHELAEDPIEGGVEVEGATLRVTDAPGIGAVPRPEVLRRLEAI